MNLRINGREESLSEGGMTLQELVVKRGLIPERIVLELNLQVIPRVHWAAVSLNEDDSIEIVSFVGGG